MEPSKPLLIFMHIPRTGGTSMWTALRDVYGKRMIRISGDGLQQTAAEIRNILKTRAHMYELVGGHIRFGVHEACSRPCKYVTVLRDPTEIVLSRFYRRQRPEVQQRKRMNRGRVNYELDKTLNSAHPVTILRAMAQTNPLTRVISGAQRMDDDKQTQVEITREHLDIAKYNLSTHFACIGLTSRFDESLEVMAAALQWPLIPKSLVANVGPNAPRAYDQDVYEAGRDIHALDYELYEFAERLIEEQQELHLSTTEQITP